MGGGQASGAPTYYSKKYCCRKKYDALYFDGGGLGPKVFIIWMGNKSGRIAIFFFSSVLGSACVAALVRPD